MRRAETQASQRYLTFDALRAIVIGSWMHIVLLGLTGAALDYTVKKFKSHRKIPIDATREKMETEFLDKKLVKIEVKFDGVKRRALL